jgi:hypothetical protein
MVSVKSLSSIDASRLTGVVSDGVGLGLTGGSESDGTEVESVGSGPAFVGDQFVSFPQERDKKPTRITNANVLITSSFQDMRLFF